MSMKIKWNAYLEICQLNKLYAYLTAYVIHLSAKYLRTYIHVYIDTYVLTSYVHACMNVFI